MCHFNKDPFILEWNFFLILVALNYAKLFTINGSNTEYHSVLVNY